MFLVAHRTPPTARRCRDLVGHGAGMFEVDIQLRADGTIRVSHYLGLGPLGPWLQHDNARVRLGWGPPRDPTLAEVLRRIPDGCEVLLDPKPREAPERAALAAAVAAALPDRDRFVVSTDREDDLRAYRTAGFRTWRTIKDGVALRSVLAGGALVERGVSVRHRVLDEPSVRGLRERVDTVVAWTVNDPARAVRLRALGVAGITTDRIAVMDAARAHL